MMHIDNSIISRYLEKVFLSFSPGTIAIIVMLITWVVKYNRKRARMVKLINKIPGPPSLPLVGEIIKIASKYLFV